MPRRAPAGPRTRRRQAKTPLILDPQRGEKDLAEMTEPYDLPFPEDPRPPDRPGHVIVVDQLRGWQPGQPPSLAELLEGGRTRLREPEPDLEAEP